MIKILLIILGLTLGEERQFYFGQNQSLIDWEKVNSKNFLNIGKWQRELQQKEESPNWEILMKDRKLREPLGRALECVGNCKLYRGRTFNKIQFKSLLQEGDEVVTAKDSYLWLFLLDGTMVRLSPLSSISLREINIGLDAIFFHVRINYGNVLWLSRDQRNLNVENEPDSDTLFVPLSFKEANPEIEFKEYLENNLFSLLGKSKVWEKRGKFLNQLINENNLYIQGKPTYSFLILPNATLTGFNLSAEFYVLNSGISYVKKRDSIQLNFEKDESALKSDGETKLHLREAPDMEGSIIEPSVWYKISDDGDSMDKVEGTDANKFWPGEFLTSRITLILVARELLIRNYSIFMFQDIKDPQLFAKTYGYRLWDRIDPVYAKDLYKRVEFLKDYTKREEKIIYTLKKKFYESKQEEVGKDLDQEYFIKALNHNYIKREENVDEFQKILLDSSK
jgi:hypothetical protein